MNLKDAAATVGDRTGVIWTLDTSSDLNANLVRFNTGQGVGGHVNDEVEVIVLGVSGSRIVTVDREEHALSTGMLVFIPKVARRATVSTSEDFSTSPFTAGGDHCRSASGKARSLQKRPEVSPPR